MAPTMTEDAMKIIDIGVQFIQSITSRNVLILVVLAVPLGKSYIR